MTEDEARDILASYNTSRAQMPAAVTTLRRANVTTAEIVRLSGLSRSGVDKILARQETTMRTLQIDAPASTVQTVAGELWGRNVAVGGGRLAEVTLAADEAAELEVACISRGYDVY